MIIADEIAKMEKKQALEELEKVADEAVHSIEDFTHSKLLALMEMTKPIYTMEIKMIDHVPLGRVNNNLLWTVQAESMHDIQYMLGLLTRMLQGLIGLQPFVNYIIIKETETGKPLATFTMKELLTMEYN